MNVASVPRLVGTRVDGGRVVHFRIGGRGASLCGLAEFEHTWRAVSVPSESVCNACHAEACRIGGVIAWKPKEPTE